MFASLKNKIKEETGNEVPALPARPQNSGGRHIRGRLSSATSVASLEDVEQKEAEIASLRMQVNELTTKFTELSAKIETLEEEKDRLEKTNEILLESVKVAQTQKDLICEEKQNMQSVQQAEITKLKSLLSFREQEAVDRLSVIRQNQQQIDHLKAEVDRLKIIEPIAEDLKETSTEEISELLSRLSSGDERFSEYVEQSEQITNALRKQNSSLQDQLQQLSNALEVEKQEKLTALLRNAEISQSEELLKKNLRMEMDELEDLQNEVKQKSDEISQLKLNLEELNAVITSQRDRMVKVDELTHELNEKNKTIKVLNQRLADLKKTLQQEIKSSNFSETNVLMAGSVIGCEKAIHESRSSSNGSSGGAVIMDEVNFKYLKHVIVKFLTSREVEARHLIRAVATLLHLNHEEEKLLHDTLNWKMSWFGSKPDHGQGQRAVSIPPS